MLAEKIIDYFKSEANKEENKKRRIEQYNINTYFIDARNKRYDQMLKIRKKDLLNKRG